MSTYALLGATGTVGNTVLRTLFEDSSKTIHAFVRSKSKLKKMSPEICASTNVQIFEGDIANTEVLTKCISGTKAVFLCAASISSTAGLSIAQDQARSVVTALSTIREVDPGAKLPTLVILSSAEADEKLSLGIPWPVRKLLYLANYHIYIDLEAAEKYLRQHEWVSFTLVMPGGLSHDTRKGHTISEEQQQTFLSYLDLCAAMVEIAEDEKGAWNRKNVSVLSNGKAKIPTEALYGLPTGFVLHFFPWMRPYMPAVATGPS